MVVQRREQERHHLSQETVPLSEESTEASVQAQRERQQNEWIAALSGFSLKEDEVVAVTKDFGTAELLMVRDTFKNPFMLPLMRVVIEIVLDR